MPDEYKAVSHADPVAHSRLSQDFKPFSNAYMNNPYPFYQRARAEEPIFYYPDLKMWIVSRYDDINAILKDPTRFSSANAQFPLFPVTPEAEAIVRAGLRNVPVLVNNDPPSHTRVRGQLTKAFSARRMAVLKPQITRLANRLLDQFVGQDKVEVVETLAFPLPALVIFTLLGIPEEDHGLVKNWCKECLAFFVAVMPPQQQIQAARSLVAYSQYCYELVLKRLEQPQDDLTSDLLQARAEDEAALSLQEISSILFALSFAAQETTANLISHSLLHLLSRPEAWEAVRADPQLIARVVEETLRYDTSGITVRRITTQAVEIGGVSLPKGAQVVLLLASANHDEAYFAKAENYDIYRQNAANHLAFGKGIHFCIGAPLARLELQIVLELISSRFPNIRLDKEQPLEFAPNLTFRGPRQLWVEPAKSENF